MSIDLSNRLLTLPTVHVETSPCTPEHTTLPSDFGASETDAAVAPRLHSQPQEYESQRPRAELCIASTSCCYFVYQSHCIASTILHRLLGLLHTTLFAKAHPPIHPPFPFPFPFSFPFPFPTFTVPNPCALISHMAPCH